MTGVLTAPFFEIGPKNLLRRPDIERIALAAGQAGDEYGVAVVLTVPTALVAPVRDLGTNVRVFAQGMHSDSLGPSMNRVTASALADAGAHGVMLNHDADPLDDTTLRSALFAADANDLQTIVCAGTRTAAAVAATLGPTVVLFEPPELIGTDASSPRPWIAPSTAAIHAANPHVLAMHAGGVSAPAIAEAIMSAGADGTGSTSGVVLAPDPPAAAHAFIAAARAGWDRAHS